MSTYNYTGFSENEYNCLLSAFDMDSFIGFEGSSDNEGTQEDYDKGIFSLHQRGLIHSDGSRFFPESPLVEIFEAIKEAENIYFIAEACGDLPRYCVYKAQRLLITTPGIRRGEYVRCALLEEGDFVDFIRESGYEDPGMEPLVVEVDTASGKEKGSLSIDSLKERV